MADQVHVCWAIGKADFDLWEETDQHQVKRDLWQGNWDLGAMTRAVWYRLEARLGHIAV